MSLISIPEYAKSRKARGLPGGSAQGVHKAVKTGRIVTIGGKVDPVDADARWLSKTSVDQQNRGSGGVKKDPEDYMVARARKEAALADLAEMEAAELRSEMGRIGESEAWWSEMTMAFRSRMLVLPPTVAPMVVGKTVAEVQAILQKMVYEALNELAGDGIPNRIRARVQAHLRPAAGTA